MIVRGTLGAADPRGAWEQARATLRGVSTLEDSRLQRSTAPGQLL